MTWSRASRAVPVELRPRLSLLYLMLVFPMFVAAFGSLPRLVNVGTVSGMGILTVVEVAVAGAGLMACRQYPKWLLLRASPYLCFMAWVALSTLWAPPEVEGIQNGLVYCLFGVMVLFSGTLAARNAPQVGLLIDRGVHWISSVALGIIALELVIRGMPKDSEEGWLIGPRPMAILGLVVLSRYLARWYHGDRSSRHWMLLWVGAMVMSVSRTATATALVLVCAVVLAQTRFRRRWAALTLPVAVCAVALVVSLAFYWAPFRERMFAGDTKLQVGGMSINVSGRAAMWTVLVESAREKPIIGKGLGSAQAVVSDAFRNTMSQMAQPHADYLRLWHDLGAIGLALYLAAAGTWMWMLGYDWFRVERTRRRAADLEFTGFLALLALSVVEITDNPVVYQAVMGTAGLLVGAGLGARIYWQREDQRAAAEEVSIQGTRSAAQTARR
jgi:O-antigen ligase